MFYGVNVTAVLESLHTRIKENNTFETVIQIIPNLKKL